MPSLAKDVPLLATKLHIPPIRPGWVARPRLVEQLDAGLRAGHRCTLVAAPAGFGKTTLISTWVQAQGQPAAWVSLDQDDNDPTRFWTYVITALQTQRADLGRPALAALHTPQPPPLKAILTGLVNQLTTAPAPLILVLDDYHVIAHPQIHEGLAFLLNHAPQSLHLVLITRADPPLPIARLRGRAQLTELRADDLRFTTGEAAAFLNETAGLDLSPPDVAALEARTEGWIVGLQLAALSMQGRTDTSAFIAAFTGSHRYVLEYLTEEVLRRQPHHIQQFLIQTSLLSRLCGPLCDAVRAGLSAPPDSPQDSGAEILIYLERHNLFVVPLDDKQRWYRYHHLFADLLQNRLRQALQADQITELHRRASAWYEADGSIKAAMTHALAARDFERAARMIEGHSLVMVSRGELNTLLDWIKALPEDISHHRPWLCVHQAWPLIFARQAEAAEPLLERIERWVSPDDPSTERREILGNVAAMRALGAMMRGDMPRAIAQARRADELLPPDNLIPRSTIQYTLGQAHYVAGKLSQAEQAFRQVLQIGRAADNLWTIVKVLCNLAELRKIQGRLREADALCQEALQAAETRGARQFGTVGYALVKLGDLRRERDDLSTAAAHVTEGIELMAGWQQPYEMVSAYTTLAAIRQAQGDLASAREALQNAQAIQSQCPPYPTVNSMIAVGQVNLYLAQGDPAEAARQARRACLGTQSAPLLHERETITLAQIQIAQGEWSQALDRLAKLSTVATAGGREGRLIEILALQAVAYARSGDMPQALATLEKALSLAEPEGYRRVFIDRGAPMAELLQQTADRQIAPGYADQLRAAFRTPPQTRERQPTSQTAPPSLFESLTQRERQVLQLLDAGYSNRQIAEELVLALNTVKKHTSNIYGKLGVRSRTQAVARARDLGLLS